MTAPATIFTAAVLSCLLWASVACKVEVLKDGLLCTELLGNKCCNGNHGKTAVVDLLGLQVILGLGVGWVQVQGVKAEGAWLVVSVELVEVAG